MDEGVVRKIAKLAHLQVEEGELPKLAGELEQILGYVERLQQADLSGLSDEDLEGSASEAVLREDEVQASFSPEEATENAPASEDGAFLVPRVIG